MFIEGPHHIITDSQTGKAEPRRLLTDSEFRFSVRMAIMQGSALSGTPRKDRDRRTRLIEDAVAAYIKICGYQFFGKIVRSEPVGGTPAPAQAGGDF
jgi:hypothetical protein